MSEGTTHDRPIVGVVGGSRSDFPTLEAAVAVLDELGVPAELKVVSAHRTPDRLFRYADEAAGRGIRVIIAGAGGAAHLPGMLASKTALPVVGVPIPTEHLGGLDSLLSIVQMPRGVPVATVAIGNATNAGLLAAARRPALVALPMPTVATGTPRGIWTIESSESSPFRCRLGIGTPRIGTVDLAASIPGRWAAPPAPAMMHASPRSRADSAY